ncbi:LysM peptidoglycan-binding domain-containing protein [Candidatus Poribacteria bacterium]|nr:LysM peptidoglycan-binding domain-containing protein [Candidatus Poribacteria bacterium]
MKTMKPVFRLTLVLYLCMFLTGAPFVLSASAKITPKKVDADTSFYEIRKGDTLWDLAKKYRGNGYLWREFEKYNSFTNPNRIYPREKLQVLSAWGFPGTQMKPVAVKETPMPPMAPDTRLDELKASLDKTSGAVGKLASQVDELHKQNKMLQDGLADIQKATKANAQGIEQLNKALMSQADASKMEIAEIYEHIEELDQKTDKLQNDQANGFEMLSGNIRSLTDQVEKIQGAQSRTPVAQPMPEASSGKKGLLTFLVALAGGATWFAVNTMNSSE